jgi:hypothetical protein
MRRILSAEIEEAKRKRKQVIIGGILILIMLLSTFGIIIDSFGKKDNSQEIIYNKIKFENQDGFWFAQNGNLNLVTKYNPFETENFTINENLVIDGFYNQPLYLYFDDDSAGQEILRNFDSQVNNIVTRTQLACPEESNCSENWPKKNCDNNFIIIRLSNQSSVIQKNKCIYIESNKEEITQLTDEFLFKLFKVKQ